MNALAPDARPEESAQLTRMRLFHERRVLDAAEHLRRENGAERPLLRFVQSVHALAMIERCAGHCDRAEHALTQCLEGLVALANDSSVSTALRFEAADCASFAAEGLAALYEDHHLTHLAAIARGAASSAFAVLASVSA